MSIGSNKITNIKKNIFNKKIFILSFLIVSATCGCCKNVNRRTNYIVPGVFLGNDEQNSSKKIKMVISEITKEEFLSCNGLNVIEDLVKEGFYKIDLYSLLENGEKNEAFDLLNLKDAYKGATDTEISYVDDNNSWFTPFTTENFKPIEYKKCEYFIQYKYEDGAFLMSSYLHAIDIAD